MGKIYPVSTKYIVTAEITAEGDINKNDIVGAIFGQTEGLLGDDLELRELQKSGRIGRINVQVTTEDSVTHGIITVPSSLAKPETAIIAASLETIERIGPCTAEISVKKIEDVRFTKREQIMDRAKNLLSKLNDDSTDSTEIMDDIKKSVRARNIIDYGPDKLAASSDIESSDEIIIVEGRADVVNLLRHKFSGLISLNGVKVSSSIKPFLETKTCTLFVDGDRGGELIVKKVLTLGDLDYIAVAPDGKEVEELTSKEINKCLRLRMKTNDYLKKNRISTSKSYSKPVRKEKGPYSTFLNDLFGTRGAYLMDEENNIVGKVPVSELINVLKDSKDITTIILDGEVTQELVKVAESKKVKNIVSNKINADSKKINMISG